MKKRRTFDREFKQMVIELSNNREDISALAAEMDIRADLIIVGDGKLCQIWVPIYRLLMFLLKHWQAINVITSQTKLTVR